MTATRREPGVDADRRQARTAWSGTLIPGTFGAMTAILEVQLRRRRKPNGHKGLKGDCRHRYRQDGKSSRNKHRCSMRE